MDRKRSLAWLNLIAMTAVLASGGPAPRAAAQRPGATTSVDWPLHNLDLAGSRFSPLDQINTTNVKSLTPRWLFQYGIIDGVSNQTTPVVVDDIMYVTDPRGSVYAVNAVDGHLLWSYDVTSLIGGGRREGTSFGTAVRRQTRRKESPKREMCPFGGDPGLQDSALFLGIKRLKYPADPPDDLLRR
jgi:glucose dehydrogenase